MIDREDHSPGRTFKCQSKFKSWKDKNINNELKDKEKRKGNINWK